MRTTLDIDKPILDELRQLGKRRKKSLSRIASELLATALKRETEKGKGVSGKTFRWNARSMRARIDIEDKDELYRVLDVIPSPCSYRRGPGYRGSQDNPAVTVIIVDGCMHEIGI